ncbi:MAG: LPXTG cell wall anchor domain-containing protein [Acidimicrobiales bacterium]|nr:LPXTG cell wall anchor domain-containing protein [Acidimicrobiales bacterium]
MEHTTTCKGIVTMASHLERFSKIRPLRALLAAGGLALLLLVGAVASPASAQDYPTPTTSPATSVQITEVNRDTGNLPRTGSDNTQLLAIVGAGVVAAGVGLLVVGKRRAHRSEAAA